MKPIVLVSFVFLNLFLFNQVYAIDPVGIKVNKVSTGQTVSITARHAPKSEFIVVDSTGEVIAGAIDTGTGIANFSFQAEASQINLLKLFAVDLASQTSPISIQSGSTYLLPPSLALNPAIDINLTKDVGVGGYTYPGSTVLLNLVRNNIETTTLEVVSAADGGWEAVFENLLPGTYVLTATSRNSNLTSFASIPLEIVVEPDAPIVDAIPKPVTSVAENVGKGVEAVVQAVLPEPLKQAVNNVSPQAEQIAQTVTPVASAGILTQIFLAGKDLLYLLTQAGISALQYFGFWRKKHPWGIVYDAITKQPIMLATVRLYALPLQIGGSKTLVETDVSSKIGVFSFEPDPGKYEIQVNKPGYHFPSQLIKASTDGEYAHVYHGEQVLIQGENRTVSVAVPMDPDDLSKLDWKFRLINFLRSRIYLFTIMMLFVGFLMSLISVVGGSSRINAVLLMFYTVILSIQLYSHLGRRRSWGKVVDIYGNSVAGIQLDLISPQFNTLVQRRVSDASGKYQFLVPPGKYRIDIQTVGYDLYKEDKKAYQGQEIWVEGDKPKIIKLKIIVKPTQKKEN